MKKKFLKFATKKIINVVIKEFSLGLILGGLKMAKSILETTVGQAATTAEIQRLNGETSLVFSEILINYNNYIKAGLNGIILITVIYMVYVIAKFILEMIKMA